MNLPQNNTQLQISDLSAQFKRVIESEKKSWMGTAVKYSRTYFSNVDSKNNVLYENLLLANVDSFIAKAIASTPKCVIRMRTSDGKINQKFQTTQSRIQSVISSFLNYYADDKYFNAKKKQFIDYCVTGRGVMMVKKIQEDYGEGTVIDSITTENIHFNRFFVEPAPSIEDIKVVYVSKIIPIDTFMDRYPGVNVIENEDVDKDKNKLNKYVHVVERWSLLDNTVTTFTSKEELHDLDSMTAPGKDELTNKKDINKKEVIIAQDAIPEWCYGLQFAPKGLPFSIVMGNTQTNSVTPISKYASYKQMHEHYNSLKRRITKLTQQLNGVGVGLVTSDSSETELKSIKSAGVGDVVTISFDANKANASDVGNVIQILDKSPIEQQINTLQTFAETLKATISEYGGLTFAQNSQILGSENATNKQVSLLSKVADEKYTMFFKDYEKSIATEFKAMFNIFRRFGLATLDTIANVLALDLSQFNEDNSQWNDLMYSVFIEVTTDDEISITDNGVAENSTKAVQAFLQVMNDPAVQSGTIPQQTLQDLLRLLGKGQPFVKEMEDLVNQQFNSEEFQQMQKEKQEQAAKQQAEADELNKANNDLLKSQADFTRVVAENNKIKADLDALKAELNDRNTKTDLELKDGKTKAEIEHIEAETDKIRSEIGVEDPSDNAIL